MKKLLKYITEYRKECILGPLFKLLEACFDLTVPLVMSWLIDRGISQNDVPYIWKMGGLLLILAAIGLTCSITAQYFAAKAAVGFATKLRHAVFKHIESLSFTEMDEAGTSMMITRMTSDINQVQSGTNLALRLFLRSPFIVFGAAVMAFTIDVKAALVFAVVIPLLALVVFGIMLITMPMYQKVQGHLDRLLGVTRQNLSGVRVIRAFNKEQAERESFGRENDLLTRMQLFVGRISTLMNPVTYIMINGALVALIWTGAVRIDMGTLKQGQIVALINYMSQILVELVKMANTIIMSTKCVACGNRIQALLEVESSLEDGSQSFEENGQEVTPARVEFDHVSLIYKGAGGESLEDITFTAEPGKTIGIIGGTGSGKSSLVHMIPRFYDATEGSVRINGQDVKSYRMDDLRQHIGIVMQKAVLFHGTIRENIRWGAPEATDEQINEALELAQAAEVVAGKPEGLDYEIEQGGRNLSGGQRQRFTIARALVRKPSVLILDDSASALDFATDAKLRKALAGLKSTSTIFIVSQRTSSIQQADKILVLDDGKLVGVGTHEKLLKNCSVYKEIYDSQFKKPEETTPSQGKER
jgi:ATP-binding cassette subfamily B multidrug efflux pump